MKPQLEKLQTQLRDLIADNHELMALNLPQIARPSVRLVTQSVPQDQIGLGHSRIGGIPDLPPGIDWPRWLPPPKKRGIADFFKSPKKLVPLGFIAQFDLQEMPRIDDSLPGSGWLYFFYDRYSEPWGFDPADRGCCRVLYADCDRSTLVRTQPPVDAEPEHTATACRVEVSAQLNIPDDLDGVEYNTPLFDAYHEVREKLTVDSGLTHHHLLGYPQLIQNPMELECQLASNGVYCGNSTGYNSDQAKSLAAGAKDWQLLQQIDTDEDGPGWMWGDVGRIYFWIKRNDLTSLRFQDAWLVLQCS